MGKSTGFTDRCLPHVVHRARCGAFWPSGQQYYHLDSAHHFGSLIQDLVEERDCTSARFEPKPFVLHGHSRAQDVGRTNRSAELELPVKTAQERPGRSRSVVDLDERSVPQSNDVTATGDDAAIGRKCGCGFVDVEGPRIIASAELQHFVLFADAFPAEMHGPNLQVFEVDGRHKLALERSSAPLNGAGSGPPPSSPFGLCRWAARAWQQSQKWMENWLYLRR